MAAKKRTKKKEATSKVAPALVPFSDPQQEHVAIVASDGDGPPPAFDAAEGAITTDNGDDTVTIEFPTPEPPKSSARFADNLAEFLDDSILTQISNQLLEGIEQDERDRSEWIQERADGLPLLGMKVERPGTGNVGSSATSVSGQSTVRDALLAEACDRFQANAFAELCPSEGPSKVLSYGAETTEDDNLAEELEKDFNFYLTGSAPGTAKEYYPDTRKMLWWTGYASGMFKKVYSCPLRERPVSESVDGADLIVPSNATDLYNAVRVTQQINMNHITLKQMQFQGAYRDVELSQPAPIPNVLDQKVGEVTGLNSNPQRPEDQDFTIYEVYCSLDIQGFEHKRGRKITGLPLPYRVVIDKDSRVILEIRRNWNPPRAGEEETTLPVAKIPFVLFPYATGLGFYGTGLLQRLGNYTIALTAMLRECIDAGAFASFPGFLYAKPAGRQMQSEFRVPPGGGAPIDVSAVGGDIGRAVMALPYKDVSQAMVALMGQIRDTASRYGGTADAPTGEGVVNAPVGSVLAAIDQATRIEGGVHKALYAAQREELGLLIELFRDDPEALWRGNKRPAMGQNEVTRVARFKQALEKYDLVPASDPNVPSHMHRLAKANTYLQLALQMAPMNVFDLRKVVMRWGAMVKIDDIKADFAPIQQPEQPQIDPVAMAALAIKKQEADVKQQAVQLRAQADQAKIQSQESIEAQRIAHTVHRADNPAPSQPDPLQAQAMQLKQQQITDNRAKMALDSHHKQADRNSKETIEAMKIGQAAFVHADAAPVANAELAHLSQFMTPSASAGTASVPSVRDGGLIARPRSEDDQQQTVEKLAALIAQALREQPQTRYPH